MLPSSSHVERAYFGPDGVVEGLAPGRLCVDMSTIDPATARRVAARLGERGVRFIDAPVSGGVGGAEDGTLAIMVGGEARDLEEARPALAAMGANIVHVGAVGAGAVAKLCNNLIAGVATVAVSEAFRIAEGFGVDAKVLTQVIANSSGRTWIMEHSHPVPGIVPRAASNRDYAPGFTVDLMCKDLGLAVNAARELRVPVAVSSAAQQVLRMASSHGYGRKDVSSVYQFLQASQARRARLAPGDGRTEDGHEHRARPRGRARHLSGPARHPVRGHAPHLPGARPRREPHGAALARRGVGPGDRVASLTCPNIPAFAVAYQAVQKLGAIAVSASAMLTTEELAALLEDSGAARRVHGGGALAAARPARRGPGPPGPHR